MFLSLKKCKFISSAICWCRLAVVFFLALASPKFCGKKVVIISHVSTANILFCHLLCVSQVGEEMERSMPVTVTYDVVVRRVAYLDNLLTSLLEILASCLSPMLDSKIFVFEREKQMPSCVYKKRISEISWPYRFRNMANKNKFRNKFWFCCYWQNKEGFPHVSMLWESCTVVPEGWKLKFF